MPQKLTATAVKAAIKKGTKATLVDGEGLRLNIDSAGRAYWQLRVMVSGKSYERTLGRADGTGELGLADAREKARQERTKIKQGDVTNERVLAGVTFGKAACEYHLLLLPTLRNQKAGAQWISSLETYAEELWNRPVRTITEADVLKVVSPIWATKTETASRVLQRMKTVIVAAKARGYRSAPLDWDAIRLGLPKRRRKVRHMPSLPWEELPAFVKAVRASAATPIVRAAILFQVATALRPGNISTLQIEWVNGDVLTIPGEYMKNGQAFRCPLNALALDALNSIARQRGDAPLAFPGRKVDGEYEALSADTLRMAYRRQGEKENTPHGMRSTFKEWSRAKGHPDWLSEAQLAHTDENQVRRAYARDDGLELRAKMMKAYSEYITG